MSILSFKNHLWVKIVAAFLVVTFLNQDIIWAQDAVPSPSKVINSSENHQNIDNRAFFKPKNVNASINIPKNLATIRESWSPSSVIASPEGAKQSKKEIASSPDRKSLAPRNDDASRKTIINIQDAHAYLGAQESIVSILDTLVRDYDIKLVAVEGTSGYIDTSLLKTFPDVKVRDNTARNLMKEGRMSAGEFFSITSNRPVALYGIEEDALYNKNVEELRKVCELGDGIDPEIKRSMAQLGKIADALYSADLKAVDANFALYKEGKIPFKHLWSVISPMAAKYNINLGFYKNLSRLALLTDKEKNIDFSKANDERKKLISAVTVKLPKKELEEFIVGLMEFKKGSVSSGDFHAALRDTAVRNRIDPAEFASLFAYTDYISEYEKIDLALIFNEMSGIVMEIKEKLFKDDDERSLDLCARFLKDVSGLFSLQLGSDDFLTFAKYSASLDPEKFRDIVSRCSVRSGINTAPMGYVDKIFDALPEAVNFYKTAEERNHAILENTIRRMSAEGEEAAALITGGYHTDGLRGLFRDRKCSYLVILPKFDASKGERPYITILTNKKKPYENLLKTGQYHIATHAYFRTDPSRTEEQKFDDYSGDFVKALQEAVEGISDAQEKTDEMRKIVGLWAENYRKFYEAFQGAHSGNPVEGFEPKDPGFVKKRLIGLVEYASSVGEVQRHVRRQPFGLRALAPGKSRVVYVTAEMKRVAQTGGLGDVSLELPEYLNSQGNEVAVITPAYDNTVGEDLGITLNVWLRGEAVDLRVRRAYLNGTWTYLLTNARYFNESGPYSGGDDSMLDRFTILSAGALELMKALEIKPDVVNVNDWHTGLVPFYMRKLPEYREYFRDIATNLTIHNLEYKGKFARDKSDTIAAGHADIARLYIEDGSIEYEGGISLIKAGIVFADTVNTVGHTYLHETLDPAVSGEFASLLRERFNAGTYASILNGISHSEWDPMSAKGLFAEKVFNASNFSNGKASNKVAYQNEYGLEKGAGKFVIGFVGRFDYIKGVDLIISQLDNLIGRLGTDVEILMLGPDVGGYGPRLDAISKKYKGKVHIRPEFGEPRTIFAVSDVVIIPSRYGTEPCNIVQMEAMRYGAVPIVFKTGGLADVIRQFDPATGAGNGFVFDTYTSEAMYQAIASAYRMFKEDAVRWNKLVNNCMAFDSAWRTSGKQYEALYRKSAAMAKTVRTRLGEYSLEELFQLYPDIQGGGLNKAHVKRVSAYAALVAEELGLSKELTDILARVGIVHDVSGAYESMRTAREDMELNQAIERRYGFKPQPKKEEALEALRAFVEQRPELASSVLPDEDKYYMSIARVIAAASELDGAPLAAWQVDWIASDMSHERHSADILKAQGIELTPVEEFLIVNHLFYPQDMAGYAEVAARSGLTAEDAKLLLSILVTCDVFENGNNAERLMRQRNISYQSLRTTFKYIGGKSGLDPRPEEALKSLLSKGDNRIMRLIRQSRPELSTDALRPGETVFLQKRAHYGDRSAAVISSAGSTLALLLSQETFYEGTPDPRINLEVRTLSNGEDFEVHSAEPHQEVLMVQDGLLAVDIYDNGRIKEKVLIGEGEAITVFGDYAVFAERDSRMLRIAQTPELTVVKDPADMVVPKDIHGLQVPEIVLGADGRQLALILRKNVRVDKHTLITNASFPIGIGFKSVKRGAAPTLPHVNSPMDNPLPELFVVRSGHMRCKVYTKEGILVKDVVLNAGEAILNLAGHSIEFNDNADVVEIIVGPYPGPADSKTPIVGMDILPVPKVRDSLKTLGMCQLEELLSLYPQAGGENINKPHCARISQYAMRIARELGMRAELVNLIGRVAAVHDLGGLPKTVEEIAAGVIRENTALIEKYGIRTKKSKDDTISDLKDLIARRPELEKYLLPDDPDFDKYYISAARVVAAACILDGSPITKAKAEELISEFSHERYTADRLAALGITLTPAEKFLIDNHLFYPESFTGLDDIAATSNMSVDEMKLLLDILIFCDVFENGNNAKRLLAIRGIGYQPISRTLEIFGNFFGGKGLDERPLHAMRALLAARDPDIISTLKSGRPDDSSDALRSDEFDFLQTTPGPAQGPDNTKPVQMSTLRWLFMIESVITGSAFIPLTLKLPQYWPVLFGVLSGIGLAYALLHFITALEIKHAFAASRVSPIGPNGKERDIARYNPTSEKVEYLWYNISNPNDVTYDPSVREEAYRRVYDNIEHSSLRGRLARYYVERHEISHASGYGEIAAHYLPGIGSRAVFRSKSDEFIGEVMQALYTNSPMSNMELLAKAEGDRRRLFALADRLKHSIGEFPSVVIKARAYLLIGYIYSKYNWFGVGAHIEKTYTDMALDTIKGAIKRNVRITSDSLKIPDELGGHEIVVSSPVRVDLSHGGASDLFAITFDRGGRAVNMAFDLDGDSPIRVRVRRIDDHVIRIVSRDLDIEQVIDSKEDIFDYGKKDDPLRLFKAAFIVSGIIDGADNRSLAEILKSMGGGIELEVEVDVPRGSGLGVSSILDACVLEGLYRISGQKKTSAEILSATLGLENVLNIGGGWQDPVGGIYGGIKSVSSKPGVPHPVIKPIKVSDAVIKKLQDRTVLYFVGKSHFAGDILQKLVIDYISRNKVESESRERLSAMDDAIVTAIEREDIDGLGKLINEFWREWKILNPEASNREIDDIFNSVSDLVVGGKLCGAGGGGFAFFIAKEGKKKELEDRLSRLNPDNKEARVYNGTLNFSGIKVEPRPYLPVASSMPGPSAFQALIDDTKTEGKYYSGSGFMISVNGEERSYDYRNASSAMEFIESTRGTKIMSMQFCLSDPDKKVNFNIEIDNELLSLFNTGRYRIDLERLIEEAIKARGPNHFESLEGRTISVALLERSQSIFEDHAKDNFIGINRVLFDRIAPSISKEAFEILLAAGMTHELSHEVGDMHEGAITRKDIDLILALASEKTIDMYPAAMLLESIVRDDSLFLRGLKRVTAATASSIGIAAAKAVIDGSRNVVANSAEMLSRLRQISKNIAVIEDPELARFKRELESALEDPAGIKINSYLALMSRYNKYMEGDDRQKAVRTALGLGKDERISYFSLEYGLSQWLNIYSGGLGILSGDTLWAANDRYPRDTFIAMGLAYRTGFFEQHIVTEDDHRNGQYLDLEVGSQAQYYRDIPFEKYGEIAKDKDGKDIVIKVESNPGRFIYAKIWHIMVGRVDLYLLDTDIPENDDQALSPEPHARALTHNLYSRGRDGSGQVLPKELDYWRFMQELLLGVGGVRALQAMGHKIAALHMNEGHSALSGIELIRQELEARASNVGISLSELNAQIREGRVDRSILVESGVTFKAAREAVRQRMAFTSHTPIPDGNEEFDIGMFRRFFENYANLNGMDIEDILGVSSDESAVYGRRMVNLSKLALNLSRYANGVSKKHGEVSRKLYGDDRIEHITNAVHRRFWQSHGLYKLLSEALGRLKRESIVNQDKRIPDLNNEEIAMLLDSIDNAELARRMGEVRKEAIEHLKESRGVELDKDAFTIVIARRAAPYKRSDLILPKLDSLMEEAGKLGIKVQVVFAGKAHPADKIGQAIIHQINRSIARYKGTAFFVENYNISVARDLTRIASVWLNNPIPPLEASGTSGMKAGLNGVVSLSTPDGWVLEADGAVEALERGDPLSAPGAAVLFKESELTDETERNDQTRENMYEALLGLMKEFAQDKDRWAQRSKGAIHDVMANFTMERFIKEYEEKAYKPSIELSRMAAALPVGRPRHISKGDFVTKYSDNYYYSNGRFYAKNDMVPTSFHGLLKKTEAMLTRTFTQRLLAFFGVFIPYFRKKAVWIAVVKDLGTNSVKYIDDNGTPYVVFDQDFVETLAAHEYDHNEVVVHILAERLAHEMAHSDSVLTRDELKAEEARIILEVDLPLYRKTMADPVLQARINNFFPEVKRELAAQGKEMFRSGRYYGVYDSGKKMGLLKYLSSLPPEKVEAEAKRIVSLFYDGGDIQNNLMAIPIQDIWQREAIADSNFKQMLADQRRNIMVTELRRLFRKVPRNFVGDFIKGMPGDHILDAAPQRLVRECGYAYRMSRQFMVQDMGNSYMVAVYNPPDVDHTEVMIVGRESPDLIHDVSEILQQSQGSDMIPYTSSTWSYNAGGMGVTVFELKNIAGLAPEQDRNEGVALTLEQIGRLKSISSMLYPRRAVFVDADALLNSDPDMSRALDALAERLEALKKPEEIEIPSVKGEDVLFLKVKHVTSFLDYEKFIDENAWTEHDTMRQRKARVAYQMSYIQPVLDNFLLTSAISEPSHQEIQQAYSIASAKLDLQGKDFIFAFNEAINPYILHLQDNGMQTEVESISKLVASFRAARDSASRLEDDQVEPEIAAMDRIISYIKINAEYMRGAAQTEDARTAAVNTINFLSDQLFFDEVRNFVRTQKKKAYVKLLEKARELGPVASDFMKRIAEIRRRKDISEQEKMNQIKVLEAMVDAYMVLAELLRHMHNHGLPLPATEYMLEEERLRSEEVLAEVLRCLDRPSKDSLNSFTDSLGTMIMAGLKQDGCDVSELVYRFTTEQASAHPELSEALTKFSAFFTIAMEGRSVPLIPEEDQSTTIYVTDAMDQVHAFRFIDKNPGIAAIATETGNSRSHWVITIEDMLIEGRTTPVMVIPGAPDLRNLKTGDLIVIDAERRRIVRNPQSNPAVLRYYEDLRKEREIFKEIYKEHRQEEARAKDGATITFLSDIPRIEPDASLTQSYGADGVGLIRMENMYMQPVEPTEDDIYRLALKAADIVKGPVTFRTLDMEKDKLKDMISIREEVGYAENDSGDRYRYATSEHPVFYGVPFYFEDLKGREIIRTQIRALMRACAASKNHNIRITIPMVENEEQAALIRDLVAGIKAELLREGIDKAGLDKVRFGAMIETPAACSAVQEILSEGPFSYISIGTNDLCKKSFSDAYERDDERLEKIYHVLFPAFLRNVRAALNGLNKYNRYVKAENNVEAYICGEWANSRKFLFYIMSLMHSLGGIKINIVAKSYKIGELKEYMRYVSIQDCAEGAMLGEINDGLSALSDRVTADIRVERDVEGRKAQWILSEAGGGNVAAWRRAIRDALARAMFFIPISVHGSNGDHLMARPYHALAFVAIITGLWIAGSFMARAHYFRKAREFATAALDEVNDNVFVPNKTPCRTAHAIMNLSYPSGIPSRYSLPALRDVVFGVREGRIIRTRVSNLSVCASALFAIGSHIEIAPGTTRRIFKEIIYDPRASQKKVKSHHYNSSLSALAVNHIADQVADMQNARVAGNFISLIKDIALDPSLKDQEVVCDDRAYRMSNVAETAIGYIKEHAASSEVRDIAASAYQAIDRRMPGRSDIVIGVPEGIMTRQGIESLEQFAAAAFPGIRVKIISIATNAPDNTVLRETLQRVRAKRGIVLELPYMLAVSALREYLMSVEGELGVGAGKVYNIDPASMRYMSVDGMLDIVKSLNETMASPAPADIETVKISLDALKPAMSSRTSSITKEFAHTESPFLNSFIISDRTRAISITTQGMLDAEMVYSLRDKIEARQKRQGVTSKSEDPVKEIVLITDPDLANDKARTARYIDALGLTPYVTAVTPDELYNIVARFRADGIKNIGIRAREGEIKDYEALFIELAPETVKLELAGTVDANSYEILLELFAQSGYWRSIPYLSKDEERNIFKYLPKGLPKNYEEEIRMHREFVKLILSAA